MSTIARLPYWSLHTHSRFSVNDALPFVSQIVERASQLGYPALGLTDHGSPSGAIQLYKGCRKFGIEPLPGIELYVVPDTEYATRKSNMHLTVAAYSEAGYRNLMHLATLSARRYWYKPQIDFADFAAMAEDGATTGLAVATGCYSGVLPQTLMRQGPEAARKVAETLAGWFPRVYVELQNHGIDDYGNELDWTDDELTEALYQVANSAGLPMVIGRDSHYVHEADRPVHEAFKRLVSFSDDPDEAVFSGDGYHMTDEEGLRKYFEPKYLEAGLEGLSELAGAACLRLPELETFTLKIPDVSTTGNPQLELEEKVMAAYHVSDYSDDLVMLDQLKAELQVIANGGMAPYILLVLLVCEFMVEKTISFSARGSACGSAVTFILGITPLDPIRFKLRFDRFLSHNRIKSPDVDLDIEHTRRDEVVAFVNAHWAVRSIGSHMKYSLTEDEEHEDSKGSLRARYYTVLKRTGVAKADWMDVPEADRKMLYRLGEMKLISGYGTHATGYIVAPTEESVAQLPLAYIASSKKLVTAYGKKDVETLGFLKLDLIGSRVQTAIRVMEELSGTSFEDIPENDRATYRTLSSGRTLAIFQLEGRATSRGCQQLRPKNLEDLIAAMALFRPASMGSGATKDYMDRRAGRATAPARHQDIMEATAMTHGVLLYQESVMDVMEKLGMTGAQLESMLDAVKASNEYSVGAAKVIEDNLPLIATLAAKRGWEQSDIDWLSGALAAYADYSFNRAHAAAYGVTAYRTAYFRTHHPEWFWTAELIANEDQKKVAGYTMEARRDKVKVLPPHVNHSAGSYSYDKPRNAIRRGLLAVKGCGKVGAEELAAKAPYTSLADLGQRVIAGKVSGAKWLPLGRSPEEAGGIIAALEDAGALNGLESGINGPN